MVRAKPLEAHPLEMSKLGSETCLDLEGSPLILAVHSDPLRQAILCLALETEGYQVIEAYTIQQCIEACKIFHPALVILDATMLESDRWGCCCQSRAIPRECGTPILAIVDFEHGELVKRVLEAGVTDCLPPSTPQTLLRLRVRQLVARVKLQEKLRELNRNIEHHRQEFVTEDRQRQPISERNDERSG